MKELMIYVERIVRPIGATQGRKLRMRLELLAHLEATLEEERAQFPGDERQAIEHAQRRLGQSAELTRQLQESVPLLERVLLGPISTSGRPEDIEVRMARLFGQQGILTLGHSVVLSMIAILAALPFLLSLYNALRANGMQTAHMPLSMFGSMIGWPILVFACYRFVFKAAWPIDQLEWRDTLKRGAAVVVLQIASLFFLACGIADQWPNSGQVVSCAVSSVGVLGVALLVARGISKLRRPYDEWLTLDIAE